MRRYSDEWPLLLASFHGHREIMEMLVNAGANVHENAEDLPRDPVEDFPELSPKYPPVGFEEPFAEYFALDLSDGTS